MKKAVGIFIFVLLFALAGFYVSTKVQSSSPSNEPVSAALIDGEVALSSQAPEGWVLDKVTAQQMGMCALYVLKAHNFENSPYLIYPRIAGKGGDEAIKTTVQDIVSIYKSHSQHFSFEDKEVYTTKSGLNFKVYYFLDGPPPRSFEAAAYLTYKDRLYVSMYSAKNRDEFLKELKSFYGYLESVAPYAGPATSENCVYL